MYYLYLHHSNLWYKQTYTVCYYVCILPLIYYYVWTYYYMHIIISSYPTVPPGKPLPLFVCPLASTAAFFVYLFLGSEPYLVKSEESNNQDIKVQVKRDFKSYSFLLPEEQQKRR